MLIEMKVPSVGEAVSEVTLSEWIVADGDYVEMDQILCELESDKATLELPAEKAGIVKIVAQEGDDLPIDGLICTIDTSAGKKTKQEEETEAPKEEKKQETEEKKQEAEETKEAATPTTTNSSVSGHPSPAAGKILRENGVNPENVKGTGKDGRITKEDAQKAVQNKAATPPPAKKEKASATVSVTPTAPTGFSRSTRTEKMSRLRRTIASHLVNSKNSTAMLTTFNEADMTGILALRAQYKEKFKEKYGVSLGFMGFFMKACATALMEMPAVNAQINKEQDHIQLHDYVDMSIAVSTPKGLVTPVVRNVESLPLQGIEQEVKRLALKGRDGKLTLEEMNGGTFTVSNGGVFGSLQSTPIINAPQSAILGMHKIQQRPMAVNGQVVILPMMYLALSYDHRIIDGKEAVTFLVKVKEMLEDPIRIMLTV